MSNELTDKELADILHRHGAAALRQIRGLLAGQAEEPKP